MSPDEATGRTSRVDRPGLQPPVEAVARGPRPLDYPDETSPRSLYKGVTPDAAMSAWPAAFSKKGWLPPGLENSVSTQLREPPGSIGAVELASLCRTRT